MKIRSDQKGLSLLEKDEALSRMREEMATKELMLQEAKSREERARNGEERAKSALRAVLEDMDFDDEEEDDGEEEEKEVGAA